MQQQLIVAYLEKLRELGKLALLHPWLPDGLCGWIIDECGLSKEIGCRWGGGGHRCDQDGTDESRYCPMSTFSDFACAILRNT